MSQLSLSLYFLYSKILEVAGTKLYIEIQPIVTPLTVTTLVQVTIISSLDNCNSFLNYFLSLYSAP